MAHAEARRPLREEKALSLPHGAKKGTGLKIECLKEIALKYKWIDREKLEKAIENMKGSYFTYLKRMLKN